MPRLFAISDLHLSFERPKPMDVFGAHWTDHAARIAAAWREAVAAEDIVLVAGDISWAMKLRDAAPDLAWLHELPGTKVLVRGNHDYWWSTIGKVRAALPPSLRVLQNDCLRLPGLIVGGTRLWDFPGIRWPLPEDATPSDSPAGTSIVHRQEDPEKIRARELERLELSLSACDRSEGSDLRVAMTHYPPLGADGQPTDLTRRIQAHRVDLCVFGHIHGRTEPAAGADIVLDRTRYVLTSCDWLGFQPLLLAELPR